MAENEGVTPAPNYPGNSKRDKEREVRQAEEKVEKPKVEKIIEGEVIQRKKPLGRRIAESFSGDDMHTVGAFVLFDVILPAAKDLFFEAVKEGLQRRLWGDSRPSPSRSFGQNRSTSLRTNYNNVSSAPWSKAQPVNDMSYKARATHNFDEVVLESRPEADLIIERLGDLIREYQTASVADLMTMLGKTPTFTDQTWGWDDIRGAGVRRVGGGGYLLDLPRTIPIN